VVASSQALDWLEHFAAAVRSRDLARGEQLFDPAALGYGTRMERAVGLVRLMEGQWSAVWFATKDFTFTEVDLVRPTADGAVVAARWRSVSQSGTRRSGRATLVLVGEPLRCVHSHFSMTPTDGGRLE
jgi:hypothetical protein